MMAGKPTYKELEQRVKERTAELEEANEELKKQIEGREKVKKAQKESEEKYQQLFQTSTDAILLFDAETRKFIDLNNAALNLYDYSREDFLKLKHKDITAETEKSDASIRQTLEGKLTRIPVRYHKKKDGTIFPVEISVSTLTLNNRRVLCGIVRDITERERVQKEIQEKEQITKVILSASPVGIGLVHNRILGWANSAMYRIWGRKEGSLLGENAEVLYPDAEEYERVGREFYSEIEEKGVSHVETIWVKKDGSRIHCYLQGSSLDPSDLSKGVIVTVMDITERKQAEELVQNLSQMLMQAQERERQMISYELHDRIAQNLSTLKIGCDMLFDGQSDIPPGLIEKMTNLSRLIEQTISSVRDLSYELRPPGLDQMGLGQALEIYCEEFSLKGGIKINFQTSGIHQLNMDADTEIHLYRLVQESLNNIQKHAAADLATIKLLGAYPDIILRIEDNGKGFDVKARELSLDNEKRMGLRSMRERVNLLGGQMTIQSHLRKGTKIFIRLPLKEQASVEKETHIDR